MENLLQRLWDEFSKVVQAIDDSGDEELSEVISDNAKMKQLRKELTEAGVKL